MTDEKKKPEDALAGFDMPEESATPPPFVSAPGQPAGIEPHVKREEARGKQPQSVKWKLIVLIGVPLIFLPLLLLLRHQKLQPWIEYQTECEKTAAAYLGGLAADSEDSVPAAYNLLHASLRRSKDVETADSDFRGVAGEFGAFVKLDGLSWASARGNEAPSSFKAKAIFEKGRCEVWFSFVPVTEKEGGKIEARISEYRFTAK